MKSHRSHKNHVNSKKNLEEKIERLLNLQDKSFTLLKKMEIDHPHKTRLLKAIKDNKVKLEFTKKELIEINRKLLSKK